MTVNEMLDKRPKKKLPLPTKPLELLEGYPDKDALEQAKQEGDAENCGDSLLTFLEREVDDIGLDPGDVHCALMTARDDIDAVIKYIEENWEIR